MFQVPVQRPASAASCKEDNRCAPLFPNDFPNVAAQPPHSTPVPLPPTPSSNNSNTAIIAGVVGAVVGAALIAGLIAGLCCWRARRRRRQEHNGSSDDVYMSGQRKRSSISSKRPTNDVAASWHGSRHSANHSTGGTTPFREMHVSSGQQASKAAGSPSSNGAADWDERAVAGSAPGTHHVAPSANSARHGSRVQSVAAHTPSVHTDDDMVGRRIAPPTTDASTVSVSGLRFSLTIATMQEPDVRAKLTSALRHMAQADPQPWFADRYLLMDEQVQGGQGVICFARDPKRGAMQYAIKCACPSCPAWYPALCIMLVLVGCMKGFVFFCKPGNQ